MFHLIIVTLFFFFILYKDVKQKKNRLSISVVVVTIYCISIALSYAYINIYQLQNIAYQIRFIPFACLFCFISLLFFYPFLQFNEKTKDRILLPNQLVLDVFSYLVIFLSLISIIYFVPIDIKVLTMSNLNDARLEATGNGTNPFIKIGLVNTIASCSSSLYNIALILSFIYLSQHKNKISYILLLSSSSYIFNVLAYCGRDGVVFWLFSFIGTYILFKDYLLSRQKRVLIKISKIIMAVFIPIFLLISKDRFEGNVINSLISYAGQSYVNFCLCLDVDYPISASVSFPLIKEIFGLPIANSDNWIIGNTVSWVFGTFIKSFVLNVGIVGTIFVGILCAVIITRMLHVKRHTLRFNELFILYMYFMVISQGVFYFRQCSRGGNLFILISFMLYFLFIPLCKNSNNYLRKIS